MTELAFEYFDPESELCNLDENGRPIRPRKKPGRKPNPPTPAQRKAQNRAAQRAFRERKRREMRETESTMKRSVHVLDSAARETKLLRQRLSELSYENKYLKGVVLTLKLACKANGVEIPKFWDAGELDDMGAEKLLHSKSKDIPQALEFFLNNHKQIIGIPPLPLSSYAAATTTSVTTTMNNSINTNTAAATTTTSLNHNNHFNSNQGQFNLSQEQEHTLWTPAGLSLNFPDTPPLDLSQPLALHPSFFQDYYNSITSSSSSFNPKAREYNGRPPPEWRKTLENLGIQVHDGMTNMEDDQSLSSKDTNTTDALDDMWVDPATGLSRTVTESPTPNSPVEEPTRRIFPPMTAIQALEFIENTIQPDELQTRSLFQPTELQRMIPHDSRIDVIPGASMRDLMIIYQDFYDADQMFKMVIDSALFLGGDLGNLDAWMVGPSFLERYWFLCSFQIGVIRLDNSANYAIKIAKNMINLLLTERKNMYLHRDLFEDCFPPCTI
ncbi:basic-leucine zipper transcription factor [Phycomyces blakesleeanus NRRL 1555(-)]|uniref:Basic-leucine zipper transcription factor n=1 Tax=Phycomyces blakesleeanus (strain ATCC 8743b / DSM 1359 / FGSC 10004 / NBRC 33097 / NRRL 1555) TaxID=763407 RepID=A0A162V712_PHYB8|nr:basic-leucine zipper transcription factor [Phycomyces blakesleeanus NRRL 1555(-)]OAD80462.1 basic-leucine zipper transcription factor [Phycomyces blakesleeanus NRRL 1555(-)]|eukprot:XP_018298502.1 basic-leucine zipper transcription factor [Phycomyces blakesleeanus NRRL 1555(-)]